MSKTSKTFGIFKFMDNLSLRLKMIICFLVPVAAFSVAMIMTNININSTKNNLESITTIFSPLSNHAVEVEQNISTLVNSYKDAALRKDSKLIETVHNSSKDILSEIIINISKFEEYSKKSKDFDTAEIFSQSKKDISNLNTYAYNMAKSYIEDPEDGIMLMDALDELSADIFDILVPTMSVHHDNLNEKITEINTKMHFIGDMTIYVGIFNTLIVFLVLGYLFKSLGSVDHNFKIIRSFAVELGKGNLTAKINIFSKDEIGQIAHSFNEAIFKLSNTISEMKIASVSLSRSEEHVKNVYLNLDSKSTDLDSRTSSISASSEEMMATNTQVAEGVSNTSNIITFASEKSNVMATDISNIANNLDDSSLMIQSSYDKLSTMEKSFGDFVVKTKENSSLLNEVEESVSIMVNNLGHMKIASGKTHDVAGGINKSVEVVNNKFEEISNEAIQTAEKSKVVISALEKVRHEAETILNQSKLTEVESLNVAESMDKLNSSINEINENMSSTKTEVTDATKYAQKSSLIVKDLFSAANEVDEVIVFIEEIARQTTLLSLNASIEASRAGEAGKGFAVVAEEVKDLARNTHEKTEEIKAKVKMIKDLSGDVQEAIFSTDKVIKNINGSSDDVVNLINHQKSLSNNVNKSISKMNGFAKESLLSSESTNKMSAEVLTEAKTLHSLMGNVGSEIESAKTIISELSDITAEISKSSDNVLTLSEESLVSATLSKDYTVKIKESGKWMEETISEYSINTSDMSHDFKELTESILKINGNLKTSSKDLLALTKEFNEISTSSKQNVIDINSVIDVSKGVNKELFIIGNISSETKSNADLLNNELNDLSNVIRSINSNVELFELDESKIITSDKVELEENIIELNSDHNKQIAS